MSSNKKKYTLFQGWHDHSLILIYFRFFFFLYLIYNSFISRFHLNHYPRRMFSHENTIKLGMHYRAKQKAQHLHNNFTLIKNKTPRKKNIIILSNNHLLKRKEKKIHYSYIFSPIHSRLLCTLRYFFSPHFSLSLLFSY